VLQFMYEIYKSVSFCFNTCRDRASVYTKKMGSTVDSVHNKFR
jgi:hypothetical protein